MEYVIAAIVVWAIGAVFLFGRFYEGNVQTHTRVSVPELLVLVPLAALWPALLIWYLFSKES